MGLIKYSKDFLLSVARTATITSGNTQPVNLNVWRKLCDLNISKHTKRGCRAGRCKQRKIPSRITWRNPYICERTNPIHSVCHSNLVCAQTKSQTSQNGTKDGSNKSSGLPSVFMCNPRSLNNKMDEFRSLILNLKVDMAMVSETWICPHLPDGHLQIQGYSMFTHSRTDKRGGGVALYTHSDIKAQPVRNIDISPELEVLWVQARPKRLPRTVSSVIICAVYNPPANPLADELIDHLLQTTDLLRTRHPAAGIILLGDFNRLDIAPLCRGKDLKQVVDSPTRNQVVLDLIITNMSEYYDKPSITSPVGMSDHNSVLWQPANCQPKPNNAVLRTIRPLPDSKIRDFGRWITNHHWEEVLNLNTVEQKYTAFYDTVQGAIDLFFPNVQSNYTITTNHG